MRALICTLFLLPLLSFTQNTISGLVSSNNQPLANAMVVVYSADSSEFLTHTSCDIQGRYDLSLANGSFFLKVSHLGYYTEQKAITIINSSKIDFELKENPQLINEIMVESKAMEFVVSGDTTHYNLDVTTNGTEESLNDILEKLPGINIDDNGKIHANGKKIDELLVDGKPFFGEQHQLAGEYISSDMISGISKYENYQDAYDLNDNEPTGITALNIQIDDNYKGQLKSQIEAQAGYKNRYYLSTISFSLKEKSNFYLLTNSNNLGKQTFSIEDYIGFQGGIEKLVEQSSQSFGSIHFDVPEFLFTNNEVKSKNEHLGALNYSYIPTNKFKLNTNIIIDNVNAIEQQLTQQQFFNNQLNTISNRIESKFIINNSHANIDYKLDSKSKLNYTAHFAPKLNDLANDDTFNSRRIGEERKQKGFSTNHNISYSRLLGKAKLNSAVFLNHNSEENTLLIQADTSSSTNLNQAYEVNELISRNKSSYGLNTELKVKIADYLSTKVYYKVSTNNDVFNTSLFNNRSELNHFENQLGLIFFKRNNTFFNYQLGTNYSIVRRNFNSLTHHFLPFASILLNFSQSHSLSLNLNQKMEYVSAKQLASEIYIVSYNTLHQNLNLKPNDYAKYSMIDLNYKIYDMYSGINAVIGGSVSEGKDVFTKNSLISSNATTHLSVKSPYSYDYRLIAIIGKRVFILPLNIQTKTSFNSSEQIAYLQDSEQTTLSNTFSTQIELKSRFKNPIFNCDVAYKLRINQVKNKNNLKINQITVINPHINLNFEFKNLKAKINTSLKSYSTENYTQERIYLSPTFKYHKAKSKWEFSLSANDILNLNTNETYILENHFSYIEEEVREILGGYITAGIKLKL
ncbi:MAG: carboxypeptidase-like regulatory domain-containing protein [Flavobacteriales bacterium]|nr:carboxypeptidase-like regulatory domain-containing protein [Flavobacteriales bacterium]